MSDQPTPDGAQPSLADIADIAADYNRLTHAMQSGVAAEMNHRPGPTEPKHLRVGVNSALCSTAALAALLIKKGLITELEYFGAQRDQMAAEVKAYEDRLTEHFGTPIHLG